MCELCGKTFSERNTMETHKLIHTGKRGGGGVGRRRGWDWQAGRREPQWGGVRGGEVRGQQVVLAEVPGAHPPPGVQGWDGCPVHLPGGAGFFSVGAPSLHGGPSPLKDQPTQTCKYALRDFQMPEQRLAPRSGRERAAVLLVSASLPVPS